MTLGDQLVQRPRVADGGRVSGTLYDLPKIPQVSSQVFGYQRCALPSVRLASSISGPSGQTRRALGRLAWPLSGLLDLPHVHTWPHCVTPLCSGSRWLCLHLCRLPHLLNSELGSRGQGKPRGVAVIIRDLGQAPLPCGRACLSLGITSVIVQVK